MTDRRALVEELFDQAVDLAPAEQAVFLDQRCADMPDIRREVEALLRSDRTPGSGIMSSTMGEERRSPPEGVSSLDVDTVLGKYRVTGVLGKGGQGVVYEVRHVELGYPSVVKMLRSRYADDPEAIERFKHEAHTLARIRHPSIVTVHDVGVHKDGHVYIVLERLDGESLEDRLGGAGKLEPARAVAFVQQVGRALAAVHAQGIIHRDLKPDNLFIVPDPEVAGGERVKILDFGIAKLTAERSDPGAGRTMANAAMGTPHYMSPEQWTNARDVDARTDLYALGVILFRMLCGRLPFVKPDVIGYMHAHVQEPAPRLRGLDARLPNDLEDIVARLLAKQPDERFATADALVRALDDVESMLGGVPSRRAAPEELRDMLAHASTASPMPVAELWRVPELPAHFLPRPADTAALIDALLAGTGKAVGIASAGTYASRHGLHGMGGIGKTVLAAAVAHSDAIRAHFVDGVYWLAVGQTPQIISLQAQLGKALGLPDTAFDNPADGKRALAEYLAHRRVLLVLDDVWDADHASWLEMVGEPGRMLVTTRNLDVLTWRDAAVHSLDVLSPDQACALLADWTGEGLEQLAPDTRRAIDAVAQACGRLPLALAMVGALVRMRAATWSRVLGWLENARLDKLRGRVPAYPYRNVYQAIEVSVRALQEDDALGLEAAAACYADLAVFPEDEPIPRAALAVLWARHGLDIDDVDDLAGALATRALAHKQERAGGWTLALHDLQRAYVRAAAEDLAGLHGAFIDAYAARCERGLERGPDIGREYFFVRLPYHLVEAGRADELRALLWSYRWLDSKLRAAGVVELLADFERVECDRPLALVRDALRLSSHVLGGDPNQLPSQIIGRLGYFEADGDDGEPDIRALLERVRTRVEHEWLCPITPVLIPPGGSLIRTFEEHASTVWAVALSADGTRALSGAADKTVKFWDTQSGQLVRTFEGHSSWVLAVALSADGRYALSGSADKTAKLWDMQTGQLVRTFAGHSSTVRAVALSADGTHVLSGSDDKSLRLWDTQTGQLVRIFEGHSSTVRAVALSADGTHALSGSDDKSLRLWDTQTGQLVRAFEGHAATVWAVALSADGRHALSGAGDKTVKLWDTHTGQLMRTFEGHSDSVWAVALSTDGARALSGSDDKCLRLWDTETGQLVRTFEGHSSWVLAVALSADGRYALSGSADKTAKLWDTQTGQAVRPFEGYSASVWAVALSTDGTRALSGSGDQTLELWDTETGQLARNFEGNSGPIWGVALSANGEHALSGAGDKTVKLWDTETGQLVHTFEGHSATVWAVALSADGTRALSGSDDKSLKLWDTENGQFVRNFEGHSAWVRAAALSANGAYALSGSDDHTVKLWDTETGQLVHTFEGHSATVWAVALSADGTRALSGSSDMRLKLWNTETGQLIRTFEGHSSWVLAVALSADGMRALSGSKDKSLKLWDTHTGDTVATFTSDWPIYACALSSGPHPMICAGDQSGRVHFLRLLAPAGQRPARK